MDIPCIWTLISFVIATAFSLSYIFHFLRNTNLKFITTISLNHPKTSTTKTACTSTTTTTSCTTSSTLPLGTNGWPILGETMEFISCAYSDHPESFMEKRRRLYGKVFKSHIFGKQTIISTDAEVNKFILQSDAKLFVPSYPKSLTELMGKSSILLINGSLQRRIHGLLGSFFKSSHLKAQVTKDMQSYVQQAMDRWDDNIHSPIFIQDEAKQAKKEMVKVVKKIIVSKRNNMVPGGADPNDVLDVLLSDQSGQLTDDLMSDNMIDMMIPGEDSVPLLITLAIKYLSDSPLILHKLTEENMKVHRMKLELGEPMIWSDYLSLPFTQMVITETLRMGNIITGLMRKAMKDVEIKGYLIPKGSCVLTYLRSVHLDEDLYDTPYQFNPWRWQNKDTNSSSFTPFGGGQRLCPGLDLARLEASIFLHHFVTRFRWEAEDDSIVHFPTVRMKKGMPVWVKRRRDP
uniref:3-epi-6-deoxocathasterone 23-monooxygenase n=1 Tax=Chenopodium quinoa TaxID=63459 RepID=A0A803LD74_CHEQI